jgi:hypothetical protein
MDENFENYKLQSKLIIEFIKYESENIISMYNNEK